MTLTVGEFRKCLFQLVENVEAGERIEFTYRGKTFATLPQKKRSLLFGLVGLPSSRMTQVSSEPFRREELKADDTQLDEECS